MALPMEDRKQWPAEVAETRHRFQTTIPAAPVSTFEKLHLEGAKKPGSRFLSENHHMQGQWVPHCSGGLLVVSRHQSGLLSDPLQGWDKRRLSTSRRPLSQRWERKGGRKVHTAEYYKNTT